MKKWLVALGAVLLALLVARQLLKNARSRLIAPFVPQASFTPERSARPLDVDTVAFDGKLAPGWDDWGWGPHEISGKGPARIVFGGYGGFILHHRTPLFARYGALSFRYRAPREWGRFLTVALKYEQRDDSTFPRVHVEPHHVADAGDGFLEAVIPWKELNPQASPFDRIVISASVDVASDWVDIDKVVLTKAGSALVKPGKIDADLAVLCGEPGHAISPLIYGITLSSYATGGTANRIGGNPITRLNWDLGNAWNTGSDWYFENVTGAKGSIWEWVDEAARLGRQSAIVVPMIGWVAKDTTSVGFPVSKFGPQQSVDPYRPEAGNGRKPDGTPLVPGPPTQTSVEAPPELIGSWVKKMREKTARHPGRPVAMYILDNEPSLWNETHRDVHPEPTTYQELLDRTIRYGSAVRAADPDALIAGPAEWGWTGYLYSAKDREAGINLRPDRRKHGDVPLVAWYLSRLAEHERKTGVRVLDVLDLHFYPQAEGLYGSNARTDRDAAALRLRSTRALWDPDYQDESWIADRVRLIPRMKEWVATYYPGRKIALGEWSFGADAHISGGLATAEALGRFGQQGLDAAFYWGGPEVGSAAYWAFRAFRDFDGRGGRFLDWSVPTRTPDKISLFASRDPSRSHVVAILINLDDTAELDAKIDLAGCGRLVEQRTFRFGADTNGILEEAKLSLPTGVTAVSSRLPPHSLKIFDLRLAPVQGN